MSKGIKDFTFYVLLLIIFGALMYGLVELGGRFETSAEAPVARETLTPGFFSGGFSIFKDSLQVNIHSSLAMLLLQVIAILFTARVFGWLFIKMGQPSVIGEILAGIVLGPSVLARFLPEVSSFLFAPESLGNINILSQIGLIFFMFVIGMELDITEVKKRLKETIVISHASMIIPFFFGMLTAYWTYPQYASDTTSFVPYALFIGVSMCITAFPVLARIIQEKGLTKSHLGTLSLASAANGDITAWCLLAAVIAIAQTGTFIGAAYTIFFTVVFMVVMFYVLRPFLNIIGNIYHNKEVVNKTIVAFMFLILIASAYTTEILGIHALFGAFMAGVIMPSHIEFRKILTEKVEDVALSIFLPLFFVSTGLKTQIGLISTPEEWLTCLLFIVFAVVGKIMGTTFPARFVGESWKDSWAMGALMNTRGLMELVVLTIGYEMNILPPSIFVMLVLMTLVTTFMTGPLLSFIDFCYRKKEKITEKYKSTDFRLLLSFGRASNGSTMLNLANQVFSKGKQQLEVTALHLTVGTDVNPIHTENFEKTSFAPILEKAEELNMNIHPRYDVTNDAVRAIVDTVNNENFDFLLVGAGISLSLSPADIEAAKHKELYYEKYFSRLRAPQSLFYPGDLMKDKSRIFIENVKSSVGIFINRNFSLASEVLVILKSPKDIFLLDYARNLINCNGAQIGVLELGDAVAKNKIAENTIREFLNNFTDTLFVRSSRVIENLLTKRDFMLISYETWNNIFESERETLESIPSTLIIHRNNIHNPN